MLSPITLKKGLVSVRTDRATTFLGDAGPAEDAGPPCEQPRDRSAAHATVRSQRDFIVKSFRQDVSQESPFQNVIVPPPRGRAIAPPRRTGPPEGTPRGRRADRTPIPHAAAAVTYLGP